MKKTKIFQFTIAHTKGGRTQYVLSNWNYIDKNRFLFDFVTFSKELDFENQLIKQGCRVFHISSYYRDDPQKFIYEMNVILHQGYDAIHIHTAYWENAIVEECAKRCGIPKIIIHSHSTGIPRAKDQDELNEKELLHNKIREQINFNLATDYCACSYDAATWLFGDRIPKDRILILHNGVDTKKFNYDETTRFKIRKHLGISDKTILIGTIGRLVFSKNQEFLIGLIPRLIKQLDVKLLVVGEGPRYDEYVKLVKDLCIEQSIIFLGYRNDVPQLLQAMDIYCMPSRFEGFPIALVEAQCSGLPCIVSDSITEEADLTDNVFHVPNHADMWIKRINECARSNYDRNGYGDVIRKKGYDIYDQITVLENLYEQC